MHKQENFAVYFWKFWVPLWLVSIYLININAIYVYEIMLELNNFVPQFELKAVSDEGDFNFQVFEL